MAAVRHAPVVIAGGGYAGLAAALALGERALVIDQHEIGAIQRSACAMPLDVAERFGVRSSVLQVYPDGYIHTPRGAVRFALSPEYCIFDHAALCRDLFARSGAAFLRARVRGLEGDTAQTSAGPVRGDVLVDASGWSAVLATARDPALVVRTGLTVGIEAEVPGAADGMHFYFDSRFVRDGYAWLFPAGDTLRLGVAGYGGRDGLPAALDRFLRHLGYADARPTRGGRIPAFQRPGTVDDLFLVGDAAGHCVPLTAEGIRFALHFGALAGALIRDAVDGRATLAEARRRYADLTARHRRRMAILRRIQGLVAPLQGSGVHAVARLLALPPVAPRFMRRYAGWTAPVPGLERG